MMFNLSPRHALAMAAALALAPALQAAQPTQEQLRSIKLYGDTTIAEDSVGRWGFWEQFEPPAAGNSPSVSVPAGPTTWYRPLASGTTPSNPLPPAPVVPPSLNLPCESGGLCGFGMFTQIENIRVVAEARPTEQSDGLGREVRAEFLPILPLSLHPYAFSATEVTPGNEGTYPYPASVELAPVALGSVAVPGAHTGTVAMDNGCCSYDGNGLDANMQAEDKWLLLNAQVAWYTGTVRSDGESVFPTLISGVAGRLTTAADMDALNKGNVTASYSGRLLSDREMDIGNTVNLEVNFGNRTFTGSVNGGADVDRRLAMQPLANGQISVQNGMGLKIDAGVIDGSRFQSTRLSATDGNITAGAVSGGFFGPGAAAAGGVIDVTKTRTDGTYTNGRFVMPFLTQRTDLGRGDK
jgi:C-lobe and N-lobe beta barrels of Tf-binding protein B